MADSWEDLDFDEPQIPKAASVQTPVKDQWDDEDQDDVKDSWDDDEDVTQKKPPPKKEEPKKEQPKKEEPKKEQPKKEQPKKEQPKKPEVSKPTAKPSAKKSKSKEEPKQHTEVKVEDPGLEKQRREKLVQQSDLENAVDLFSGVNDVEISSAPAPSLETIQPTTETDFEELSKLVVKTLTAHEKNGLYPKLMKGIIRQTLQSLPSEELKDVSKLLTVMINDKIKAEKDKPKKKAPPKKFVNYKDAMEDFVDDYDFL